MTRLAKFELHVTAIDTGEHRTRWNGGPFPSDSAHEALNEAVDAFKNVLKEHGLEVARTGYGVTAEDA